MIRITQLKLPIEHKKQELYEKTAKLLRVAPSEIKQLKIVKQSVDARKKEQILFIYTIDVEVAKEQQILKKVKNNQVSQVKEVPYQFPSGGEEPLKHPPVIIGSGPAGLFTEEGNYRCSISLSFSSAQASCSIWRGGAGRVGAGS